MINIKNVVIMLSTYNGEKYLIEQLESIINQIDVNIFILIRDDGSSDGTLGILNQYSLDKRIQILSESNIGSTNSFMKLVSIAPEADFYSFADQDDIWDIDKLSIAIQEIDKCVNHNAPIVYSSNTILVDKKLQYLRMENKRPRTDFGSAIIKNYATGCTLVFNRELMNILQRSMPKQIPYHDWWINLVCLANNGISIFDNVAHMRYRQHNTNLVGASLGIVEKYKTRLKKYKSSKHNRDIMMEELLYYYEDYMINENANITKMIINYKKNLRYKIRIILNSKIRTDKFFEDFLFAICILTNKA